MVNFVTAAMDGGMPEFLPFFMSLNVLDWRRLGQVIGLA